MSFDLILPFMRPIEPLLLDEDISEIMGNPDGSWWYERDGKLHGEGSVTFDAAKLHTGLLREVRGSASMPSGPVVLTEIVGLHLFLINVLSPIARGERITQEHYQEIIRQVREHKHGAAADILGNPAPGPTEVRK